MKVGDYVYDWELGLWGLILSQDWDVRLGSFTLLYEDGNQGDAFENALTPSKGSTNSCKPGRDVV